jgi:hypothetical protein
MDTPEVINQMFIDKLSEPGGKEKIAASEMDITKDKLRKESFIDKFYPPRPLQRSELQVSLEGHDTLLKVEFLEPNSRAIAMPFRAGPDRSQYVTAGRYGVALEKIKSSRYEKLEEELLAYPYSILDYIKSNVPKDMAEIKDRIWILNFEKAVQRLQLDANSSTATRLEAQDQVSNATRCIGVIKGSLAKASANTDSYIGLALQKDDLTQLFKLPVGSRGQVGRLAIDQVLMTDYDFEDVMTWTVESNGDKVQSEVVVSGWKYNTFMGRTFLRTIKTDILREGNLFGSAKKEFVGKSYTFGPVKFYIDKVAEMITFWAWQLYAGAIGNIAGLRKLELYPGSNIEGALSNSNTGVATTDGSVYTDVRPKSVEDMFGVNNKAAEGGTFPRVVSY